ncbi:hypothetical protein ACA910_000926 [Epithemia clementina (nom. ined.)]
MNIAFKNRDQLLLKLATGLLLVSLALAAGDSRRAADGVELSNLRRESPFVSIPEDFWLPASLTSTNEWSSMKWKDVEGCCRVEQGATATDNDGEKTCSLQDYTLHRKLIGKLPQFTTESTQHVLDQAVKAWNGGMGVWTQMTMEARISAITQVFEELKKRREEIVEALMWEIGKNRPDAESEFDRTVKFAMSVIDAIRSDPDISNSSWQTIGSTRALVRRAALGVILCLGPYNYPINETYATLIPALLMGNICILKIPSVGGIAHLLTMEAFAKVLPPATINFVAGPGSSTVPPLMKSGKIDGLAFIGGSEVADTLIKDHPHPHRLKVFLQLEANNMAIYLADLFQGETVSPFLQNALEQAIIGSLSYNGQRCTALKLHMVPQSHADFFARNLAERVEALSVGLPWQQHESSGGKYSDITPLPNAKRISKMKDLLEDAVSKGAKVMNKDGGKVVGGSESTLMVPAVLYPVSSDMRLYHEEQFGPLIPVATYDNIDSVIAFGREGIYAQQVSIFGYNAELVSPLIDAFSAVFGKINLNSQCGRSPDTIPFSGRRSSAMGVMSVTDALKEFSTPTVVAYKDDEINVNNELVEGLGRSVNFLQPVVKS